MRIFSYIKSLNWSVFLVVVIISCIGALARKDVSMESALLLAICFGVPLGLLWAILAREEQE